MAICPLLSLLNQNDTELTDRFVDCKEQECQWYIKRIGGGIEVYDCAIPALALYAIRDLTQK